MAGYYTVMAGQTSAENIYRVDKFERAFAEKMNIRHALALCSGTACSYRRFKSNGHLAGVMR